MNANQDCKWPMSENPAKAEVKRIERAERDELREQIKSLTSRMAAVYKIPKRVHDGDSRAATEFKDAMVDINAFIQDDKSYHRSGTVVLESCVQKLQSLLKQVI